MYSDDPFEPTMGAGSCTHVRVSGKYKITVCDFFQDKIMKQKFLTNGLQ